MKYLKMLNIAVFTLMLSLSTTLFAEPRIGERMPEFQLQGTDGRMYGLKYSDNLVSVFFFVGNW